MSASAMSPTSPIAQRDMRSAAKPSKRDKDHGAKWSNGSRPSYGVVMRFNGSEIEPTGGSDSQKTKVRPEKTNLFANFEPKSRANITPRHSQSHTWDLGRSGGRVARSSDAHFDAHDASLSRSLLDLVPNTRSDSSAITIADVETLYSFDNTGPSPNEHGRKVGLESLVEKAEKKWVSEQTEKIVRGEYEVLDGEGETTTFKKGKRSPKQKAIKTPPALLKEAEDDDGFELI